MSAKNAKSVEDQELDDEWLQGTNIHVTKVGLSEILKWISKLIFATFHSDTFASICLYSIYFFILANWNKTKNACKEK